MRVQQTVQTLFHIRADEGQQVRLLFGNAFLAGLAIVFSYTAAISLFLAEWGAERLPYVFIASALIVAPSGFLYTRIERRFGAGTLFASLIAILFVTALGLRLGMVRGISSWLAFSLLIWFRFLFMAVRLEYWGLAGRLLTLEQGKRLYGLIGAGEIIALILGYAVVPILVPIVGPENLLSFSTAVLGVKLLYLLYVLQRYRGRLAASKVVEGKPRPRSRSIVRYWRNSYSRYMFLASAFTVLVYFFIDYGFFGELRRIYEDAESLASFVALFYLSIYTLTFISRIAFYRPLLRIFGMRTGLLILPSVIAAVMALLFAWQLLSGTAAIVIWLVASAKLLDEVLFNAFYKPSTLLLYQPMPEEERLGVQATAEGVIEPLALGLSGVALLLFGAISVLNLLHLALLTLLVTLVWLITVRRAYHGYAGSLTEAMSKRLLEGQSLLLDDASSAAVIEARLQSEHPLEVLYALDLLERAGSPNFSATLATLVNHPQAAVREAVLLCIERNEMRELLPQVMEQVKEEQESAVLAAAIRAFCTLQEADIVDQVAVYLDDPSNQVKQGAIVGLLRGGGIAGVLRAGQKLLSMAAAPDPTIRQQAAVAIGEIGAYNFYEPLVALIDDPDEAVQQAAIEAAAAVGNRVLWPRLAEKLREPKLARTAAAALVAGGEGVMPTLAAAWEQSACDPAMQQRLAQIYGRIGGAKATSFLVQKLNTEHAGVRSEVLHALSRCGYQPVGDEVKLVQAQLLAEIDDAAWIWLVYCGRAARGQDGLLNTALMHTWEQARHRLFYLLSFLYDTRMVLRARDNWQHTSAEKRAFALEALDIIIAPELKRLLRPLLEEMSPAQRLQEVCARFPHHRMEEIEYLQALIANRSNSFSPWTRACALHALGTDLALVGEITEVLASADFNGHPILHDTALALQHPDGDTSMLSLIEKVIILKSVSTFEQIPEEILAEIALRTEEVVLGAEERLFDQGDVGDSMYIIVSGEVRVHGEEHVLTHLGPRTFFGEMAILDPAPRSASVTAVEETLLLRLDQESLYELMDDRSDVAKGIIRVLSRNLRSTIQELDRLQAAVRTQI